MTRLSDKVAAIVRGEELSGRLVQWQTDTRPGVQSYELQYFEEKHAHDLAGVLFGLGIKIDSSHTQVTHVRAHRVSSITFRVPWDASYYKDDDACPACKGKGHMGPKLEPCWHCEGEGVDPAP